MGVISDAICRRSIYQQPTSFSEPPFTLSAVQVHQITWSPRQQATTFTPRFNSSSTRVTGLHPKKVKQASKGPVTHALESSVYAETRSQERKMAWQRRKAELPLQRKLQSASSNIFEARLSLLRIRFSGKHHGLLYMDLLREICMRMMSMQQKCVQVSH